MVRWKFVGKPVKGWRKPQRREDQAEGWPGSPPGGGRTGLALCKLAAGRWASVVAGGSRSTPYGLHSCCSAHTLPFHLDGGLASSFRTWLKCHISRGLPPLFCLVTALFSIGASGSVFLPAKELNIALLYPPVERYPPRRQGPTYLFHSLLRSQRSTVLESKKCSVHSC